MRSKFLTDRALLLEPDKILVIADLHMGLETELYESGITVPSQMEKLRDRIDILIKETKAKQLIFLGDIKHDVKRITGLEFREIPLFFEHFIKKVKVHAIKGNHDGDLEKLVPKEVEIYDSEGFSIKNFAFIHGNAWPSRKTLDCEYIGMGHMHPAIEFWREKFRTIEHCWVRSEINQKNLEKKFKRKSNLKTGIIMPTFNPLTGGLALNSDKKPEGIASKILKWKDSEIFLLDGTYLGRLNEIKQQP